MSTTPVASQNLLLTIVMKHHPGLTLDDVQSRMKCSDWWESFPPEGTRIVSWTVAMGLGPDPHAGAAARDAATCEPSNSNVVHGACSAPSAIRPTTSFRCANAFASAYATAASEAAPIADFFPHVQLF